MKTILTFAFCFFLMLGAVQSLSAQHTTVTLPTTTNASSFGITKSNNDTLLKMFGDGGFYLGGTNSSGAIPKEGEGTRLMWYPKKAALRAGTVTGTLWNDNNIGEYSVGFGYDTKANGTVSTAMGERTTASGYNSTAMGAYTSASGIYSTAMGYETSASNIYSTAMGANTTASGEYSTAMGFNTTASGNYSTAIGYDVKATDIASFAIGDGVEATGYDAVAIGRGGIASGFVSIAMGDHTTASGDNSTAMGWQTTASGERSTALGTFVSTDSKSGAFIIGDGWNITNTNSSEHHQMTMRFDGGYRLFTKFDLSTGVTMATGANSWSSVSDSTKKTNFLKSDGEYFLSSLSKLKLGSWNYKSQDERTFRHYGPMAQEIFHYFGNDGVGTIGNDTTLATADMDGIVMICLQALEKRTQELTRANETISAMRSDIETLKKENEQTVEMKDTLNKLSSLVHMLIQEKNNFSINTTERK